MKGKAHEEEGDELDDDIDEDDVAPQNNYSPKPKMAKEHLTPMQVNI